MAEIRASDYFAIIPEWVLLADISANAVRLYGILNRYANSNGHAWPSRKTIADAMKVSTATVDRAREELVDLGAMTVIQRKTDAGDPTSNLYVLHTRPGDNVENSSPMTKGIPTRDHTGIRTRDNQNRASLTQSQKGKSSRNEWCPTCHGRRVVMSPAETTEHGVFAPAPIPCPECANL